MPLDVVVVSLGGIVWDGRWLACGTTEQRRKFEAANPLGARDPVNQSPWCWNVGSAFSAAPRSFAEIDCFGRRC